MATFEEQCIERYFLAPGNSGPIAGVYVADEDLLEMFSVTDVALAHKRLLASLPHVSILKARFSGDIRPLQGKPPDYVRILIFLCWMQTTKTRKRGDRDFRELLEKQIGTRFTGANMSGLNLMWEHLRDFLAREHDIKLVLPAIHANIRQIGRTLQIAFPTWRDRAALRKLRQILPPERLLEPLEVSNRIYTSRHLLGNTMQSFEYNFEQFDCARKNGGREYARTPFWHAWYSVIAEQVALEDLEVVESDFGEYELFRVSPVGDRVPISSPDEAVKFVPKSVAKMIRGGTVFLESLGFGRYRAQASTASQILLMYSSKLAECTPSKIRFSVALNSRWVVAAFRGQEARQAAASGKREFGWLGGIRVGGAYLGRTPLTPVISSTLPLSVNVEISGRPIDLIQSEGVLALSPGIYSGPAVARSRGASHEVLMVPRANEVGETRRLAFDPSREIPEDEFHYGSAPSLSVETEIWQGERFDPRDELVTLGEALYARTARGLSFSEAVELVRKAIGYIEERPSVWDILRSFADAGWLETTLLRHFPVRRILQRPLSASLVSSELVRINGPTPLAVIDRISASAYAVGCVVEKWRGTSPWTLPRYVVRCPDESARKEFVLKAALGVLPSLLQAVADVANCDGVHGYSVIGRFDEDRGFFAVRFSEGMTEGLYRLERPGSNNPFLYRSVVRGSADQNYFSPSVALLSHHLRQGNQLFDYDGQFLSPRLARVVLPASWARWISDRALCNAGPRNDGSHWRYEYPLGHVGAQALSKIVPIAMERRADIGWIDRFVWSASNSGRTIYDGRLRKVRSNKSSVYGKRL
ncbi:hypothetical protein [Paracoccus sp. MKU1]|uniref:hypothetical protein n=1 Tax=Paracoccus sp. MKU1 TaxID=1745182 RepID=UPI00193E4663|nr:hypothetical protein [Paracoccus sp. MKU1]